MHMVGDCEIKLAVATTPACDLVILTSGAYSLLRFSIFCGESKGLYLRHTLDMGPDCAPHSAIWPESPSPRGGG